MADNSDVLYLRLLLAEPHEPTGTKPAPGQGIAGSLFSSDQLELIIDRTAMISRAAEVGWNAKAAYFQSLIDVEESGVSRKLSQMFKQAQAMAAQFKVTADEEWQALQGSVRTVGVAGSPWGPQWNTPPAAPFQSYLIGDVSNASYGGSIFFIEVPVDPDLLTDHNMVEVPAPVQAVNELLEIQVPTDRRNGLYVEVGRTFNYLFDYLDPASGATVDITGWTATLTVRTAPGGPQLYQLALETQADAGKFALTIPSSATGAFDFVQGDYEVVASDTSGNVISLVSGTMYVTLGDS